MHYTNPILPGFHPDPSLCRVGPDYYLVTSSFEYFPGVPVFHSRNLFDWQQIGYCLTRPGQFPVTEARSSGGIFAPTLRWHQGTFYMITTNVTGGGNFFVTARDPAGEWSDPVWLDQGGIDPSLFFDDDGRVYFTGTNAGRIVLRQLDLSTGRFLTPETGVWQGTGGQYPEGPHLYKRDGYYYLMIAEGGTEYGHMETIARSRSPFGPYESCPHNPILSHRSLRSPIQATGHADLVQAADGGWWCVCLGIRPHGYPPCHHLGRETFLAPVHWDAAGWPVIAPLAREWGLEAGHPGGPTGGQLDLEMHAPASAPGRAAPPTAMANAAPGPGAAFRDDFDAPQLDLRWNFLRYTPDSPRPESWSLAARPGWLQLRGAAETLDQAAAVTFLGVRQEHFDCQAATRLDFSPHAENEEAGLVVRQNEQHHYEIAVTVRNGQRGVLIRRRVGSLAAETPLIPLPPGPVDLTVTATPGSYRFAFQPAGGPPVTVLSAETRYLATEVAGGFTGVYLGLYATGNGSPCSHPAFFDWFTLQPGG